MIGHVFKFRKEFSQIKVTKRPTMSAAIQFHSQWYITKPASWVKPHIAGLKGNSKLMRNNMVSFTVAIKELEKIETRWLFTQSKNKWTILSLVSSVKWLYSFHQRVKSFLHTKKRFKVKFAVTVDLLLTDTSLKRTPRVGPCLSLLPLFDSL